MSASLGPPPVVVLEAALLEAVATAWLVLRVAAPPEPSPAHGRGVGALPQPSAASDPVPGNR